jgi:prepilin-type N-terminal cleavage/methylation domain-containing protein
MHKNTWRTQGFSLSELVVVMAILSIVSISVYTSFRTVAAQYEKNDADVKIVENARAALNDMTLRFRDLVSSSTPFIRSYAENTTPVLTNSLDSAALALAARGYGQDSVYFLSGADESEYKYYLDTTNRQLMRYKNGTVEPLAFGVESVSFLFYNRDTEKTEWLPLWDSDSTGLPRSIYIALTIRDEKNRLEPHTYTTLVTLP